MRLLLVDHSTLCHSIANVLKGAGHRAAFLADAVNLFKKVDSEGFDAVIVNLQLPNAFELLAKLLKSHPDLPVLVFTTEPTIESVVRALRMGVCDYLLPPFAWEQWKPSLERISREERRKLGASRDFAETGMDFHSEHPEMRKAIDMAFRAAPLPVTLLLLGESGTGKSMLARMIHARSPWNEQPFVTLNCPCLKSELLESELFGHQRGSFTGAVSDTWGKVAAAEGGTLFLDEVGELPLEIQPKLLRLLQDREYERVGENKVRKANVRVIAATNRNLEQAVKLGHFREDLFYRLNVVSVTIPSLRERPNDLMRNAERFLKSVSNQIGKNIREFTPAAIERFQAYHWPGNLRELKNVIERAAILCDQERIDWVDLPDKLHSAKPLRVEVGSQITLKRLENEHIRHVIARSESFVHAARILGIDPGTLNRKRKKMEHEAGELLSARMHPSSVSDSRSTASKYQRSDKEYQKHNEQNFGDSGGRSGDSGEPEDGRNHRDDKEENRIA